MKILLIILQGIMLLSRLAFSQQSDSLGFNHDRFWNNVLEEYLTNVNETDLNDELEILTEHPVDLNTAALEDLLRIPFLSYQDAKSILEYRRISGRFFSTYELRLIKGLPNSLIDNVLPYIFAGTYEIISISSTTLRAKPDVIPIPQIDMRIRMQTNSLYDKGVTANSFEGTPVKLYNRLKVSNKGLYQLGFIMEKDAGEESFTDFSSFHFLITSLKPFETILIGDYNIEFGEGLTLWSPYGFLREGSAVSSMHMEGKNIKPYLSTDENSFLRGGAIALSFSGLNLTAFYSGNFRDANLDTSSGEITSFYTSGYHRNNRENLKKDRVKETLIGGRADYRLEEIFKAGLLYYRSEFNHPFPETSPFSISGNKFDVFSLSYQIFFNRLYISGEAAMSGKKSALKSSLEIALTEDINALVSIRHYEAGFPSMHSFSSGSSSGSARQETGIYTGMNVKTRLGTLDIFYDQFRIQTRRSNMPSNGNKFGLNYSHSPIKKLKVSFSYRSGYEEICDFSDPFTGADYRQNRTLKAGMRYDFTGSLFLKLQGSLSRYFRPETGPGESGFLLYEETGVSKSIFSLAARLTYFKTDSYYSRVFQAESGTPGSLSGSALYGNGVKWFMSVRLRIIPAITVSMKYSEIYSSGAESKGYAPPEEFNSILSLQLDMKL